MSIGIVAPGGQFRRSPLPQNDPKYYRERAREERRMAERATCATARIAHEDLAEKYECVADGQPVTLNIVERG